MDYADSKRYGGVTATFASTLPLLLRQEWLQSNRLAMLISRHQLGVGQGDTPMFGHGSNWEKLIVGSQSTGSSEKWMFTPSSIGTYAVWVVVTDSSATRI